MTETMRIVTHYLEEIVRRAELRGFDEMRIEIEAAVAADEKRLKALEIKAELGAIHADSYHVEVR